MLSELGQTFSAMEDDSDIRCGVLCAEGRNFTAGLELNQVAKHLAEGPLFPEDNVDPVNLHGRLRTKPLVSRPGHFFTLGIELMLASDIVVASSVRADRGETRDHALSWRDHPDDRAGRFGQRLAIPLDQ
jgi:enoyl-CoA hydratase